MSKMAYKLYYFGIRGRAEPIRMLFVNQKIDFDEVLFPQHAKWSDFKHQFAFAQVPCLKDYDLEISQSGAIMRHLGRKHNLDGDTEAEKVFADSFYEGVKDLHERYQEMINYEYENRGRFVKEVYPVELGKLEKLLKKHVNGEKFVLGEKLSYADYMLFEELDIALILSYSVLDNFPALKAYHHRFAARPHLKEYLEKRNLPVNYNGRQ